MSSAIDLSKTAGNIADFRTVSSKIALLFRDVSAMS